MSHWFIDKSWEPHDNEFSPENYDNHERMLYDGKHTSVNTTLSLVSEKRCLKKYRQSIQVITLFANNSVLANKLHHTLSSRLHRMIIDMHTTRLIKKKKDLYAHNEFWISTTLKREPEYVHNVLSYILNFVECRVVELTKETKDNKSTRNDLNDFYSISLEYDGETYKGNVEIQNRYFRNSNKSYQRSRQQLSWKKQKPKQVPFKKAVQIMLKKCTPTTRNAIIPKIVSLCEQELQKSNVSLHDCIGIFLEDAVKKLSETSILMEPKKTNQMMSELWNTGNILSKIRNANMKNMLYKILMSELEHHLNITNDEVNEIIKNSDHEKWSNITKHCSFSIASYDEDWSKEKMYYTVASLSPTLLIDLWVHGVFPSALTEVFGKFSKQTELNTMQAQMLLYTLKCALQYKAPNNMEQIIKIKPIVEDIIEKHSSKWKKRLVYSLKNYIDDGEQWKLAKVEPVQSVWKVKRSRRIRI